MRDWKLSFAYTVQCASDKVIKGHPKSSELITQMSIYFTEGKGYIKVGIKLEQLSKETWSTFFKCKFLMP